MDKLIIEFNKKFDKQKQELIDGFKALGEEKRLPKALATIEGEQPTYKDYFKAGWQSRQAEVDEANAKSQMCRDEKTHAINRWSQIRKEVEEKDKRIEEVLFVIARAKDGYYGYSNDGGDTDNLVSDLEKALGDNNANS